MMSKSSRLLFDTHALLAFFSREKESETVKNLVDAVQNGDAEGFVATTTLYEIGFFYSRYLDAATGDLRVLQVAHSKITAIPLSAEIILKAGTLKRPGIFIADAIIAASALSVGAVVVTNEPHFSEMGVEVTGYP
jgi:predicted nucleic acid-binding protein